MATGNIRSWLSEKIKPPDAQDFAKRWVASLELSNGNGNGQWYVLTVKMLKCKAAHWGQWKEVEVEVDEFPVSSFNMKARPDQVSTLNQTLALILLKIVSQSFIQCLSLIVKSQELQMVR